MKHSNQSIQNKLFKYLIAFLFAVIAAIGLMQSVFFNEFYVINKKSQAESAASKIEILYGASSPEELSASLNEMAADYQACIIIINSFGEIEYDGAHVIAECEIHHSPPAFLIDLYRYARSEDGSHFRSVSRHTNGRKRESDTIVYAQLINNEKNAVIINSNVLPITAVSSMLRMQLILISLIILLLAMVLAAYFSRRISRPLADMNIAAKHLAKGDYDITFKAGGYKEVQELADSLNYAATELSKTDMLRKELIANISHDLRTPLTMITGYAEIIRDIPAENSSENIQIIIDEAQRLSTLVNDLLDLSKLQAGVQTADITKFSITGLINEILGRYTYITEKRGYRLEFEYNEDISVPADKTKITQVIYNLINNAVNYSANNKYIKIVQTRNDGKVKIQIIDSGIGIADDMLPYIWERYYKADENHQRAEVGTGLGLSIVKSILDLHAADFGVQSRLGEGSTFWFELETDDS